MYKECTVVEKSMEAKKFYAKKFIKFLYLFYKNYLRNTLPYYVTN